MPKVLKKIIKGRKSDDMPMVSGDRVVVFEEALSQRLFSRAYGEMKKGSLYLNLYEACLLLEDGKLEVFSKGEKLGLANLIRLGEELNEGFGMKYEVFRDLRATKTSWFIRQVRQWASHIPSGCFTSCPKPRGLTTMR